MLASMRFLLSLLMLATPAFSIPKLIAHRGASEAAPENTLAAFKLAWEEGADGIEGDFFLTGDGQIVCVHDADTKRTSGRKVPVGQTTYEELRKLDVGRWKNAKYAGERIPLLSEVLAIIPEGKYFFIEIKSGQEIVGPLKKELAKADPELVMIISFNADVVAACRKELPNFQAHLVSSLDKIGKRGAKDALLQQLDDIGATGLQFKFNAPVGAAFIDRLHKGDRLCASWTVNDPKHAARLAGMGLDFLTTDRPGALRRETDWPSKD